MRYTLSDEDLESWGWRIPFLMSIIFGVVGMPLRNFYIKVNYLKLYNKLIVGITLRNRLSDSDDDDEVEVAYLVSNDNSSDMYESSKLPVALVLPQPPTESRLYYLENTDVSITHRSHYSETQVTLAPVSISVTQNIKDRSSTLPSVYIPIETNKKGNLLCAIWQDSAFNVLIAGLISAFWGCGYYTSFVWLTYFISDPHLIYHNTNNADENTPTVLSKSNIWVINFIMNAVLVVTVPFFGWLGDYLGE